MMVCLIISPGRPSHTNITVSILDTISSGQVSRPRMQYCPPNSESGPDTFLETCALADEAPAW